MRHDERCRVHVMETREVLGAYPGESLTYAALRMTLLASSTDAAYARELAHWRQRALDAEARLDIAEDEAAEAEANVASLLGPTIWGVL